MMKLTPTNIRIMSGNGKTGASFSIPNVITCPGRTASCEAACYVDIFPMSAANPTAFRARNYGYVIEALKRKDQLYKELITACKLSGSPTIRIHDAGDFFSPEYTRQWIKTCKATPDLEYWAYTRSFSVGPILAELVRLARLSNVAVWLSADQDNWLLALTTFEQYRDVFAGVAFMELADNNAITETLAARLSPQRYVNFPTHIPGGRIKKGVDIDKPIPQCPAILGIVPHAKQAGDIPACVTCLKCLPSETKIEDYDSKRIERARARRIRGEVVARLAREVERGARSLKTKPTAKPAKVKS